MHSRASTRYTSSWDLESCSCFLNVQVKVEIEGLLDGEDFSETLTRAKFEELNADLFKKTLKPVEQVLADSGLKKTEVHEIVLV